MQVTVTYGLNGSITKPATTGAVIGDIIDETTVLALSLPESYNLVDGNGSTVTSDSPVYDGMIVQVEKAAASKG